MKNTINILGATYKVIKTNQTKDKKLKEFDGYVDLDKKIITLDENASTSVLKHEVVHAFLYESGLDNQSWANNEEIVDWIALQLDKMSSTISNYLSNE